MPLSQLSANPAARGSQTNQPWRVRTQQRPYHERTKGACGEKEIDEGATRSASLVLMAKATLADQAKPSVCGLSLALNAIKRKCAPSKDRALPLRAHSACALLPA